VKLAFAALLVLLASHASAGYLRSDELRRRCDGREGEAGKAFCAAYLQGQFEAWAEREEKGERRRCIAGLSEPQLYVVRLNLMAWLFENGTATADIDRALSSANFCP
jgi:hypothetical protein